MKPSLPTLLGTHVVALCLAYAVARNLSPSPAAADAAAGNKLSRSKSATREREVSQGDGERLLAAFRQETTLPLEAVAARYRELKGTLAAPEDAQTAFFDALRAVERAAGADTGERVELAAIVAVRSLQFLRASPDRHLIISMEGPLGLMIHNNALRDFVTESGLRKTLEMASQGNAMQDELLGILVEDIRDGGGITKLAEIWKTAEGLASEGKPFASERFSRSGNVFISEGTWMRPAGNFLASAGEMIPFAQRDALWEMASGMESLDRRVLVTGFVRNNPRAAEWMMDKIARGEVDAELAAQLKGPLGNSVLEAAGMDIDKRVEARRGTEGNADKPRQELVDSLVRGDVQNLLDTGRDWRYEFRHGNATAEEVLAAVKTALPGTPPEGETTLVAAIYTQLSEESPARAAGLLDLLPEDRRRSLLFHNTWQNYVGIDPDVYLESMKYLPEPETAEEKDFRTKGWNWKARGYLARYGEDYVEWVKQMPPGLDKDTAMNSLIWATREQNPAKADELRKQLYPPKP